MKTRKGENEVKENKERFIHIKRKRNVIKIRHS